MELIEKILIQYNCLKCAERPLIKVSEMETTIGVLFPTDYKTYIRNYLGFEGYIGKEFLQLWDFDDLLKANRDYGILERLPKTIGIGANGNGEFIAIEFGEQEECRVVLSPLIDLDRKYHIEIGTSFSDFLVRLESGQEWFNDNAR